MSNATFSFAEIESTRSFTNLAHSMGGQVHQNTIRLNSETGTGVIRKFDFEKGLHMRCWDLHLITPYTLHHCIADNAPMGKAFTILYIVTTDAVEIKLPAIKKVVKLRGGMKIVLISDNCEIGFHLHAAKKLQAIDITVSTEWMMDQFNSQDEKFIIFMKRLMNVKDPCFFLDAGSTAEYKMANVLHQQCITESQSSLHIKSKTLTLASDFFVRAFNNHGNELLESRMIHQEKMLEVERVLTRHLEKNLPGIDTIAKEASLSESTLKRHFKLMYGKSIYEYYLEKKMEHAKRLLLEKPLTVKEVAFKLGYEKPSNFIQMFKKFYDYSPGSLKKM